MQIINKIQAEKYIKWNSGIALNIYKKRWSVNR